MKFPGIYSASELLREDATDAFLAACASDSLAVLFRKLDNKTKIIVIDLASYKFDENGDWANELAPNEIRAVHLIAAAKSPRSPLPAPRSPLPAY